MLNLVRFWILLSSVLVGGGWILSALHQLNGTGYAVVLSPVVLALLLWWRKSRPLAQTNLRRWQSKIFRRFRRRMPQLFLLIAALAFLGGCLYPPANVDANAYRLPRVMHWLAAGQWHWIHTFDLRMNIAACGMEWLSAPLILFSHTDRLLFLPNWLSYLMLPGLIFSVFTRLQVRPRVAWWWMWLLSSGWCFALQAGSVANDSFAAVYILAAIDLALRARQNRSAGDLWLSLLAVGLVTGAKQTNVPLAALWFIAAWPARALFWRNPLRSAAAAGFGLLVSIVPISLLNFQHYGTWLPLQTAGITSVGKFHLNPFWGIIGNAICLPLQNLLPPFYNFAPPFYSYWPVWWNDVMRHFLDTSFGAHFASFENFGFLSAVYYNGFSEGNAGLGLGICILIFAAAREIRRWKKSGGIVAIKPASVRVLQLLRLAPWGLLLVFMAKVGTYENARHIAPYYLLLFPAWLVKAGHVRVTRQLSWQQLAFLVMSVTVLLVITLSERPLFPANPLCDLLASKFPNSELIKAEYIHYRESGYQPAMARRNFFSRTLPPHETVIGLYAKIPFEDEPGIWLPYGQRRVEYLLPGVTQDHFRALSIHYVVVSGVAVKQTYSNIGKWMEQYNASLVAEYTFSHRTRQAWEPPDLYLVRLN
jgi:hypothetical protein